METTGEIILSRTVYLNLCECSLEPSRTWRKFSRIKFLLWKNFFGLGFLLSKISRLDYWMITFFVDKKFEVFLANTMRNIVFPVSLFRILWITMSHHVQTPAFILRFVVVFFPFTIKFFKKNHFRNLHFYIFFCILKRFGRLLWLMASIGPQLPPGFGSSNEPEQEADDPKTRGKSLFFH